MHVEVAFALLRCRPKQPREFTQFFPVEISSSALQLPLQLQVLAGDNHVVNMEKKNSAGTRGVFMMHDGAGG